jgi:hypothetical protein
MRLLCERCGLSYNDEYCSTVCPHKGIGYCVVCDCTVCLCTKDTAGDWERSQANKEGLEL